MQTFSHLCQYLAELFLEWETFQTKVVEEMRTHMLSSATFFRKCAVYEIMLKNMVETEATNGNMAARYMLN